MSEVRFSPPVGVEPDSSSPQVLGELSPEQQSLDRLAEHLLVGTVPKLSPDGTAISSIESPISPSTGRPVYLGVRLTRITTPSTEATKPTVRYQLTHYIPQGRPQDGSLTAIEWTESAPGVTLTTYREAVASDDEASAGLFAEDGEITGTEEEMLQLLHDGKLAKVPKAEAEDVTIAEARRWLEQKFVLPVAYRPASMDGPSQVAARAREKLHGGATRALVVWGILSQSGE